LLRLLLRRMLLRWLWWLLLRLLLWWLGSDRLGGFLRRKRPVVVLRVRPPDGRGQAVEKRGGVVCAVLLRLLLLRLLLLRTQGRVLRSRRGGAVRLPVLQGGVCGVLRVCSRGG